jgi:hypothetical protein
MKPSERSTPTEAIYLATDDLEGVHRRAQALGCLSPEFLHNDPESPAGEIVLRPWGERSFYAVDPSGNPLCFVDTRTVFTGTPDQVAALRRPKGRTLATHSAPSSRLTKRGSSPTAAARRTSR